MYLPAQFRETEAVTPWSAAPQQTAVPNSPTRIVHRREQRRRHAPVVHPLTYGSFTVNAIGLTMEMTPP